MLLEVKTVAVRNSSHLFGGSSVGTRVGEGSEG